MGVGLIALVILIRTFTGIKQNELLSSTRIVPMVKQGSFFFLSFFSDEDWRFLSPEI